MANKKAGKNVAGMTVLQDIRGLISSSKNPPPLSNEKTLESAAAADIRHLEEQLKEYEIKVHELKKSLDDLKTKNTELETKLNSLQMPVKQLSSDTNLQRDISDLEARKEELSEAVSRIDELLQFKTRELVRRIARVYEEAGDMDAGRDFRRLTNQLEAAENFGEFVRSLIR